MRILHHSQLLSSGINPIIIRGSSKREIEIRVCTNRTCRRQGSFETLDTLLALSPPNVFVKTSGCLGRCGSGPNLVALPDAVFVSHCATPSQAARLIAHFCPQPDGDPDPVTRSLDALAFRKTAEIEFQRGNSSQAEALFSQAIEAKPIGGIHVAYKGRSAVRLALGNWVGALEDSKEALVWHPQYAEAYICQGDAFLAMDQLKAAEESYNMAMGCDPSLRRSKSFKSRVAKLHEMMTATERSRLYERIVETTEDGEFYVEIVFGFGTYCAADI